MLTTNTAERPLLDDLGVRGESGLAVTSSWPGDEQAFDVAFAGR